ncbi:hypothetical protein Q8A67_012769 [Cirrhinus molitorella]|uniref:Uncharacterized protein n=1 Tax=Cirrhinus molitorella TaxID=172907 RepID=A0AA88PTQ6_9TELE|nr:hypothetical protein Q8A67_012769 [Cirrhinus molitorella]
MGEKRRRVRVWSARRPQLSPDRVDSTATGNQSYVPSVAMAPRNTTQYLMDLVYAERPDVSMEAFDRDFENTVKSLRRLQLKEAERSASQLRDDVYATPRPQVRPPPRGQQVADPPRWISAVSATHPEPWDKASSLLAQEGLTPYHLPQYPYLAADVESTWKINVNQLFGGGRTDQLSALRQEDTVQEDKETTKSTPVFLESSHRNLAGVSVRQNERDAVAEGLKTALC